MLEKDSDEEELDRLVLGDNAGFMAQIARDMEPDDANEEVVEDISKQDEDEEIGLEGVDDEDVRSSFDSSVNSD